MIREEMEIRFNEALDTNRDLQEGMETLIKQFSQMTEDAYINETLRLFRRIGMDLSRAELKQLLDQRLQREVDRLSPKKRIGTKT